MPHQTGSDQQSFQHSVHYTQTTTRSLHRSWHGACQRHLSERSHLVMAFLYCQFTTEGLDIIKTLNIQGHKNHTEHSSHSTLFHSNTPTRIAMVHNAVPNQLTQSISTMCLYTSPFIYAHCQSAHNLLPKSISITHSASYNISTTITKLYSKQQTQWEIKQY